MKPTPYITVDSPKDYLVIEKTEGNAILKGSHIYCGICGGSVGTMKEQLSFPFKSDVFMKVLKGKQLIHAGPLGMAHKACGQNLFTLQKGYSFITLERFNQFQLQIKEKQESKLLN